MAAAMRRRVSAEEARDGYLMIEKTWLRQLPPVGESFLLDDRGATRCVTIEAAHCECRGPEKPHDHYRIAIPALERGTEVTLERVDRDGFRLAVGS
jgi:hypothetical protein